MTTNRPDETLAAALEQLRYALELLDAADAPPQIGAHVDLAIQQLYSAMARKAVGSALDQFERSAELQ